jgi:hypothetical protein
MLATAGGLFFLTISRKYLILISKYVKSATEIDIIIAFQYLFIKMVKIPKSDHSKKKETVGNTNQRNR